MLASHGAITICKQHLEPSAICSTTSLTCSPKHNFRTYSFELFKNPKYSPHQVVQLCTSSMSSSLLVFPQQALQVCVFYCVISVKSDLNLGWFELFHSSKCSSQRALFAAVSFTPQSLSSYLSHTYLLSILACTPEHMASLEHNTILPIVSPTCICISLFGLTLHNNHVSSVHFIWYVLSTSDLNLFPQLIGLDLSLSFNLKFFPQPCRVLLIHSFTSPSCFHSIAVRLTLISTPASLCTLPILIFPRQLFAICLWSVSLQF